MAAWSGSSSRRKVERQLKQLAHIEELVVSDPEIMRGTPVFKGTRIPVDLVAGMLAQGATAEEILEGYLNTIYYGYGAYGVQAASQFYYGKNASELNLAEASMLAGIPKGPGIYSPLVSLEKAEQRKKVILTAMKENGVINEKQAANGAQQSVTILGEHPHASLVNAPYFQDAVRQALKTELQLDERTLALGGLKVYTTLDLKQQKIAEDTIASKMSDESDIQVGFIAMDPRNGYVKALVGGRDYTESPFNRAIQAIRQPGSTIKPLLYYAALEQGFTPATQMLSELTTFRFEDAVPRIREVLPS
jgi:membrane peptidoglycan carboxypeptidase